MVNIFRAIAELPIRRAVQVLRNRVSDLNKKLGYEPVYFDQYPGKANSWCFSCIYGPILPVDGLQVPDDPTFYYTPNGTNILTGRDASFVWKETNVFAFNQRNTVALGSRGLFDPERIGGGATVIQNLQGPQAINNNNRDADDDLSAFTNIVLEMDLYDKKRGRSITSGPMPIQALAGGAFDNRAWRDCPRFDPDTEIEPRLYVRDAREPEGVAEVSTVFFVNVVFKGISLLQEVTGREELLAKDKGGRS